MKSDEQSKSRADLILDFKKIDTNQQYDQYRIIPRLVSDDSVVPVFIEWILSKDKRGTYFQVNCPHFEDSQIINKKIKSFVDNDKHYDRHTISFVSKGRIYLKDDPEVMFYVRKMAAMRKRNDGSSYTLELLEFPLFKKEMRDFSRS